MTNQIKNKLTGEIIRLKIGEIKKELGLGSNWRFCGLENRPDGGVEYGVGVEFEGFRGTEKHQRVSRWYRGVSIFSGRVTELQGSEA